ncbi:MAG: hypothetical protein EA406_02215 [Rhodospirillales bacterium]|nr:MAG: hypothetical protein EA406_02215 [Rhodospirillales bacterium]
MSWEALNAPAPEEPAEYKALRSDVARALNNHPMLEKYLRTVVMSGCYTANRSFEQVTFAEGQRRLALDLLKLGGKFDG